MKKLWKLFISITVATMLVACGQKQVEDGIENSAVENKTVTVTDHLGREVELTGEAKRIVSGYYITTSMLIGLGVEEDVVGVEAKANTRPIYALAAPELLELPNVGTAKEFNLEGCLELDPDLVILPVKLKDSVSALENMGVTVLAVNPENEELLKETFLLLGEATGKQDEAKEWIEMHDDESQELVDIVEEVETKPTVYLGGNSSLLSTGGAKMYQNTLIEMAGGVNVAADITDTYWAEISYEQLIEYNPEVIVLASDASYTKEDVLSDEVLKDVDAVKNGRVYKMPGAFEAWDSPVPGTILGAQWLCSILYPQESPYDDFVEDVKEFYEDFYGVEINTTDLEEE